MKIFDTCPACDAPVYDDPLSKLFVPAGVPTMVYECGAHLAFFDVPPVHVKVITPCPYAFRVAINRKSAVDSDGAAPLLAGGETGRV